MQNSSDSIEEVTGTIQESYIADSIISIEKEGTEVPLSGNTVINTEKTLDYSSFFELPISSRKTTHKDPRTHNNNKHTKRQQKTCINCLVF